MKKSILIFILGLLLGTGSSLAGVREISLDELVPSSSHKQATLIILKVMDRYHYKRHRLDDALSEKILTRYLESLDPNKSFFHQQDIADFSKYQTNLDDALRRAQLSPAFNMFKIYRQRVGQRVAYAMKQLQKTFEFVQQEAFVFDRGDVAWAKDSAALDEVWRKRVKNDVLTLRLTDKSEKDIKETLTKRYEGMQHRTRQLAPNDVFQTFINAYTLSIEPHTAYMTPSRSENFDIGMRLSLEGIGAVLRNENDYTVVQSTVLGGPAGNSGQVQAGDRIIGVGQEGDKDITDVVGWRLQDVVELIRGPKGTVVRLLLLPEDEGAGGNSKVIKLVRDKIKLEDQAAKKSIIEVGSRRIGVIDLPAFYRDFKGFSKGEKNFRSTTRDVRVLLEELESEGVAGVVIDLRGNGGGSLAEATELTGLFIPSGPVVQVKNATGDLDIERDPDPEQVYTGPLAVLVDRHSASASEIFAGAIQDYNRGIIVGEPSFGKGTVQTLIDLGRYVRFGDTNLGRLRLTMAQFFRVNGGSTQFKGVVPDIIFPTGKESSKQGERSLDNALPWASIAAADYSTTGLGALAKYRSMHEARIQGDAGFKYLSQLEAWLKEARDEKTISLEKSVRQQRWEERKQLRKEQRNTFRVSVGLTPTTEEQDKAQQKKRARKKDQDNPVSTIMLKEAVNILSDYIEGQTRSAMVQ